MHLNSNYLLLLLLSSVIIPSLAAVARQPSANKKDTCTRTTVAILGGGMAGITAAQSLSNASIHDFRIIEYRDTIGGRAHHAPFGKDKDGNPYIVELGANWVEGVGNTDVQHENPVWALAKEYGLKTSFSNYSNISTYNEYGYKDYSYLLDVYDKADDAANDKAGIMLRENLQDLNTGTGLALAGWKPRSNDMEAKAVEWKEWDFEDAFTPTESSLIFGYAGTNLTFNGYGEDSYFVVDQRGYNEVIKGIGSTFLKGNDSDPRLHLNTRITDVAYDDEGVTVHNQDGSCITAAYAICTFSLGVLQNNVVNFTPALPEWKQTAIQSFSMGTYTKIFMQFNQTFWPADTQFFLYADPATRGWYPLFQSLTGDGFLPGSNIIFVTVTNELAWRAERQSDEVTKAEIMEVLRNMFPDKNIPEPTAFMYPRWTTEPWSHGSYSNWPPGTTLETHENLRANASRIWFAGEATSATYFGYLHGAWSEGHMAGSEVAGMLQNCTNNNGAANCHGRRYYETLHGTTRLADYTSVNGWTADSFYDGDGT